MSVDGGAPTTATGTANWLIPVYAKNLSAGPHTLTFTATDTAGNTEWQSLAVNVFHSNPVCAHTLVTGSAGIFCEQAVTSATGSLLFPSGHKAGDLIVIGVMECCQTTAWTAASIANTAGYTWTFWGNIGSASLGDGNIVQDAVYYAFAPSTTTTADTITLTNAATAPFQLQIADAVEYSGTGPIDGAGGSQTSWGGPADLGDANATSGNFTSTPGDLLVAFVAAAPTIPAPGWTERVEDITRPMTMIADQIATGSTANAQFLMNVEGSTVVGLAFKPALMPIPIPPGSTTAAVFVDNETPAPVADQFNPPNSVYNLAAAPNPPASLQLFVDHMEQHQGSDYTLSQSTIVFNANAVPAKGAILSAFYRHF